jgi:deazaflavin-dependent oxidoreductase (nitroreductase family)
MARVTAPMARALAGRRFSPLWAVVHHRGRKTGRMLSVPVAVRATGDAFVIVLPWGPGTNWVRNVQAAGGCVVRWKGADHWVDTPEVIGTADARAYFGGLTWKIVERVMQADSFLRLHRAG